MSRTPEQEDENKRVEMALRELFAAIVEEFPGITEKAVEKSIADLDPDNEAKA